MAHPDGNDAIVNISGCVYDGRLLTNNGTNSCGGFVGWHSAKTINVSNSLYVPSGSIPSGWTAITNGATFVRGNNSATDATCYFTEIMSTAQGTHAIANATAPANLGSLVQDYGMVTAYENSLLVDGTYYVAYNPSGTGAENDPYIISNNDDWLTFAAYVNGGNNFSGKFVKLTADISVSEMAGTSETNSFQGTFLGDGHTLTFTKGSTVPPSVTSRRRAASTPRRSSPPVLSPIATARQPSRTATSVSTSIADTPLPAPTAASWPCRKAM